MSFKVEENKSVKWPVTVAIPRDGGRTTKATFSATFKLLEQDELDNVMENGGDREIGCAVLQDWEGVSDADGSPMPFSEAARDRLLAIPYIRTAIVSAYFQCSSGREAARKN